MELSKEELTQASKLINRVKIQKYKKDHFYKNENINQTFTEEELTGFFCALPNEQFRMLFLLQLGLSLRISEAVSIKINQIDFLRQSIYINEEKTSKVIQKHIPESFFERLMNYIEHNKHAIKECDNFVWFSYWQRKKGKSPQITIDYARKIFNIARRKAGLDKIYGYTRDGRPLYILSTHSLRRTGITRMAGMLGGDVFKLKSYSGHRTVDSLERYVQHANQDEINAKADEAFSPHKKKYKLKEWFGK